IPDFPMPVRMTRPLHSRSSETAHSKRRSRRSTSARIAAASVWSTRRAIDRSATERHSGPAAAPYVVRGRARLPHDVVDGHQAAEQRLQPIQRQRVLRVASGPRRLVVHFEKDRIDAGGDAGAGESLDVLGLAGADAVAAAGEL